MANDIRLTSPELARLIGVSERMPTVWAERGYLAPTCQQAQGRGSKRLWNKRDAVHGLLVKLLQPAVSTIVLRKTQKIIEQWPGALLPETVWRVDMGAAPLDPLIFFTTEEDAAAAPLVLTVRMRALHTIIDKRLAHLHF